MIVIRSDVFPDPFGPNRTIDSPVLIRRLTLLSILFPSTLTANFSISIMTEFCLRPDVSGGSYFVCRIPHN